MTVRAAESYRWERWPVWDMDSGILTRWHATNDGKRTLCGRWMMVAPDYYRRQTRIEAGEDPPPEADRCKKCEQSRKAATDGV